MQSYVSKVVSWLIIFSVIFSGGDLLASPTQGTELIPDLNLGERISAELELPIDDITEEELLNLVSLTASDVKDITGLSRAVHIEELVLEDLGSFTEVEIIYELDDLEILELSDSHVQDDEITGVSKLNELKVLNLEDNDISNLAPLKGLSGLKVLDLRANKLKTIIPLGRLKKLEILDLAHNNIASLSSISKLVNLKHLDLAGNEVTDITTLVANEGLGQGDFLYLQNNLLDLSVGSEDLENIETLKSRGVKVTYLPQRSQT